MRPGAGQSPSPGAARPPWALLAGAVAGVWLADGATARAQEREPVHVAYEAPPGCPDGASFVEQVRARTVRWRPAGPDEPARSLLVDVRVEAGQARGRLRVREQGGQEAAREIAAATCEEAVSALALITAVAIDPDASTVAIAPPPSPREPVAPIAPPPAFLRHPTPAPPPSARWRAALGADLAGATGLAPSTLVGIRPFVELARHGQSLVEPAFRLSFVRPGSAGVDAAVGSAELTWTAGRVEGCPLRWPPRRPVTIQPCAFMDLGVLEGSAAGVPAARDEARFWAAPGLQVRLQATLFDLLLVEVEGGASVALRTYRFYFGPETTLHETGRVSATLGVGAGVRFP